MIQVSETFLRERSFLSEFGFHELNSLRLFAGTVLLHFLSERSFPDVVGEDFEIGIRTEECGLRVLLA